MQFNCDEHSLNLQLLPGGITIQDQSKLLMTEESTICALSTPAGQGAIAVIRMSGPEAVHIATSIFRIHGRNASPVKLKAHTTHYGRIEDNDRVIDEVIMSLFKKPHSYTGEDIVEISCHGSRYIQQEILKLLINRGARLAKPGEFTQRAFLNGKMDLSQAEGVADLIASGSAAAHR